MFAVLVTVVDILRDGVHVLPQAFPARLTFIVWRCDLSSLRQHEENWESGVRKQTVPRRRRVSH